MDKSTSIIQNSRYQVGLAVIILLLAGYGAWTTTQLISLQAGLARMEASHASLGRYVYDFGAPVTPASGDRKTYVPFDANSTLSFMRRDPLLRPIIEEPRARQVLIEPGHTVHNSFKKVIQ